MMNIRGSRPFLTLGAALLAASCGGGGDSSSSSSSSGVSIAPVQAVMVNQDTTAVVPLKVMDGQASVAQMTIAATPTDSNVVVAQGVSVQNDASGLNLLITPLDEQTGSTTINVKVTDPKGATAQTSFTLTVKAVDVNFSAIADQVVAAAETAQPLSVNGFTVVQDSDSALPSTLNNLLTAAQAAPTTPTTTN